MIKLMKLELKRNNIKTYLIASVSIFVVMTGFLYLFAYAPHVAPDPELNMFSGYSNIISLFSVLNMAVFATLSATMYTRFIIEEYKDKRAVLLFSYPVRRDKILLSKLLVVFLFTVLAMTASNLLSFGILAVSESFSPLVADTWTLATVLAVLKASLIMSVAAAAIGIIATGIGFIKKSVPATIISGLAFSSVFCNIVFNSMERSGRSNDLAFLIFTVITLLISLAVSFLLMNKTNHMEVA